MSSQVEQVGPLGQVLRISSEAEAYGFLESVESGNSPVFSKIVFDGWPSLGKLWKTQAIHGTMVL